MSNYSVLQRNTLDGLSDMAGILYLKLCDAFEAHKGAANERKAFLAACRFENGCAETLDHILTRYPGFAHIALADLRRFFAERWRHNFMPKGAA